MKIAQCLYSTFWSNLSKNFSFGVLYPYRFTDVGEILHEGGDPPCQISPPSVQREGYRTPKLKFLLRVDQNVEYKRPYPLRDFQEFCRICNEFQNALAVEIWMDLLKGLPS